MHTWNQLHFFLSTFFFCTCIFQILLISSIEDQYIFAPIVWITTFHQMFKPEQYTEIISVMIYNVSKVDCRTLSVTE